jgi:hypothetical protein
MCAFKPICPMWPQGEEFLSPAHPPAGLDPATLAAGPRPVGSGSGDPGVRNGGGAR